MKFLVTQLKNEKRRIQEWVEYNFHIGFDKIIIYVDYPTDGSDELIKQLSEINSNIIWFYTNHGVTTNYTSANDYHGNIAIAYSLADSYMRGLQYIKDNFEITIDDWVGFFDVDEFVVQTGEKTLTDFLNNLDKTIDRLYFTNYDMKCPIDLDKSVIEQSLYRWSDETRNTKTYGGADAGGDGLFSSRGKSMSRVYNLGKIDCCHALDYDRNKTNPRIGKAMSTGGVLLKKRNSNLIDVFHEEEYFKMFHYRNDALMQVYDEYDDSALKIKMQYKDGI
jgi:hypothetical protein